jgi:hypothetical protein
VSKILLEVNGSQNSGVNMQFSLTIKLVLMRMRIFDCYIMSFSWSKISKARATADQAHWTAFDNGYNDLY